MAEKPTRLERFAEWFASPWFAIAYCIGTCFQAVKGGWIKARAESLPTKSDNK